MSDSSHTDLPEDQLPHEVVAALRDRHGPKISVPESLDKAILADAASHLRTITPSTLVRPKRRSRTWIAVSTGSLAAAMLLFVMWPGGVQNPEKTQQSSFAESSADISAPESISVAVVAQDVDQNGTINILDAFALARTIDSNNANTNQWDLNGDGQTNGDDINLIAMTAVTL
jgi:hypothetical protein